MEKIADTLANILDNESVAASLDKTQQIDETIKWIQQQWMVNLDERNPAPAYKEIVDGFQIYKGTDFDLFTFMNALADRKAVINFHEYESMTPETEKAGQRRISSQDRHGEIMGLIANKNTHAFSVRIKDHQIVQLNQDGTETVGVPRNFALVDYNGKMYDGWTQLQFNPSLKENEFLSNKQLWADRNVTFENFVHPNLAFAFYGSRYLATKVLAERLENEARHYRAIAKDLRRDGIKLGGACNLFNPFAKTTRTNSPVEKKIVENLEAKLITPGFSGEYPLIGLTREGETKEYEKMPAGLVQKENVLRYAERRARKFSYQIGPQINSCVRAVELAYFLNGFEKGNRAYGNEKQPGWDIPSWQRDIRIIPRGAKWNILDFGDAKLAYRIKQKTVQCGCNNAMDYF